MTRRASRHSRSAQMVPLRTAGQADSFPVIVINRQEVRPMNAVPKWALPFSPRPRD
jgi:hypothetical protein